jgi:P4 family phage/plasmid primase-like protien
MQDKSSKSAYTVFPLHGIHPDGTCKCFEGAACTRTGKHPAIRWSKLSPGEVVRAEAGAGHGIVTGAKSGIFVVDTDTAEADARFREWLGEPALETYTVRTPKGARHYYFVHPGFPVACSVGKLLVRDDDPIDPRTGKRTSKIDVRGDGGIVVMAGSPHASGGTYAVEKNVAPARAPEKLLAWPELRGVLREIGEAGENAPHPVDLDSDVGRERFEMGREACATFEPAIAGAGGSGALWSLALHLVRTLELPIDTCRDLVRDLYNPRCVPAWSEAEILHKLEDARDKSDLFPGDVHPIDPKKLTKTSGLDLSELAARAAHDDANGNAAPIRCSDTGNAELFAMLHADRVRYVPSWRSWLVWDGRRWQRDELNVVQDLTKAVIARRWEEVHAANNPDEHEAKAKRVKWALATESRKGRESMLALAQAEPGIAVAHDALDADAWLLNVENGTIDLRTGELREHDRGDLATKLAPVVYDAEAKCPTWDRFLERVTGGHAELVAFLARAVGYSLTGDVGEHALFFLHGAGANGKSTFTKIVRELLGDYAKAAAPDLLLAKHGEAHPTEIADLHGARVALCQEVEQSRAWAEATLKQLTGGDRVKARRMREDFWEFEPTHKLWVCANHRPRVRGADEGIWRRIKLVPFSVTIPEHERDRGLLDKLRAELPGILAWAVRGCLAWQRDGLGVPEEVRAATDAYREEEDRIVAFIDERCEVAPDRTCGKGELYEAYKRWAISSGEHVLDSNEFRERLASKGFAEGRTKTKGRHWKGIRIQTATFLTAVGGVTG